MPKSQKIIDQHIRRVLKYHNPNQKITKRNGTWLVGDLPIKEATIKRLDKLRTEQAKERRLLNLETATFMRKKAKELTPRQKELIKEIRKQESENLKLPRLRLSSIGKDISVEKLENRIVKNKGLAYKNSVLSVLSLLLGGSMKNGDVPVSPDVQQFLNSEIVNMDQKILELSSKDLPESLLTNLTNAIYQRRWESVINIFNTLYERYA